MSHRVRYYPAFTLAEDDADWVADAECKEAQFSTCGSCNFFVDDGECTAQKCFGNTDPLGFKSCQYQTSADGCLGNGTQTVQCEGECRQYNCGDVQNGDCTGCDCDINEGNVVHDPTSTFERCTI